RYADAAVAAEDDPVLVLRVPPHRPEVAERAAEEVGLPGLAAVARDEHVVARDDHGLIVVRVDPDLVERVRRLAAGHVDVRHLPPGPAGVVRAVQLVADDAGGERAGRADVAAGVSARLRILVLEQCIEDLRVLLVDVDPDSADPAGGKAAAQALPFVAAIV